MPESVWVLTPTVTEGRYGDREESWDAPTRDEIAGCKVAPRYTVAAEDNEQRSAVVDGWDVYAPTGTVVGHHQRLEVRGQIHDVDGEPAVWFDDGSPVGGVLLRTRRVRG